MVVPRSTARRVVSAIGLAGVLTAGLLANVATAGDGSGLRADVRSSGTSADMTIAGACGPRIGCGDTGASPEGEIRVTRNMRLRVELSDPARRAHGDLVRIEGPRIVRQFPGKERARAVNGSRGRAWSFRFDRLPRDANAVLFRAYHRPGQAELDDGSEVSLSVWSVRIADAARR